MDEKKVNDWGAAKQLDAFHRLYVAPVEERVKQARLLFMDPDYKWKPGEKDRAKAKKQQLESDLINFNALFTAVKKLIEQHEAQTDMLTEIYAEWFHTISTEGMHPLEIMKMQQDVIQRIWLRIYNAIEPLKLNINPPKTQDNEV